MSEQIINKTSELFINLPEQEQEAVSGGISPILEVLNLVFSKTDIESFASDESKILDGNINFYNKRETGYKFSQINFQLTFIKYLFL
jgi:hypothetical protein